MKLKEKILATTKVKVAYRAVDVGNYTEVDAAISSSIEEIGPVDFLVNNVNSPPKLLREWQDGILTMH